MKGSDWASVGVKLVVLVPFGVGMSYFMYWLREAGSVWLWETMLGFGP